MKNEGLSLYFKQLTRRPLLLVLLLVGVGLLLFGARTGERKEAQTETTADAYIMRLEDELTRALEQVEGVGRVTVMITLSEGERVSYSGSHLTSSEMPKIAGVAVICDGGGRDSIRAEIGNIVTALFGIGRHRVSISEKKS